MAPNSPSPRPLLPLALATAALALVAASCIVNIPDDGAFQCSGDGDCGGGGYVCAHPSGQAAYCCLPQPEECDGKDNDCNGVIDDLPPRSCYTGPAGTAGVGSCRAGRQACAKGAWGECQGEVLPAAEQCDQQDADCDGKLDCADPDCDKRACSKSGGGSGTCQGGLCI